MRRAFVRPSGQERTIAAHKDSWRRSFDACLRRRLTKTDLQAMLADAVRNTAALQQSIAQDDEVVE